jgi:hypothetical protein
LTAVETSTLNAIMTATTKWWCILFGIWTLAVALLILAETSGGANVARVDWTIPAAAVIFPAAGLWAVLKGIAAAARLQPGARRTLARGAAIGLCLIAVLIVANSFFRYETVGVGDGRIMQVDRLTQQVRTCIGYKRTVCSDWSR